MAEAPKPTGGETLLELRDLKTHFFTDEGVARAVDGVSYVVKRGETLGVDGASSLGHFDFPLGTTLARPRPQCTDPGWAEMTAAGAGNRCCKDGSCRRRVGHDERSIWNKVVAGWATTTGNMRGMKKQHHYCRKPWR